LLLLNAIASDLAFHFSSLMAKPGGTKLTDKEIERSLLEDIELRGGLCVYIDFHKNKEELYGTKHSAQKGKWQNKTSRWKKLPLLQYLKILRQAKVQPHLQTQVREVQLKENRDITPVTWYPLSTDKSLQADFPARVERYLVVLQPFTPGNQDFFSKNGSPCVHVF
jgi:hypothetical protein